MFSCASECARKHALFQSRPRRHRLSTVYLLLSAFFGLFQSHPGDAISPPLPPASLAAVPHNASTRIASLLNNKTGERGPGGEGQRPKTWPFPEPPRRHRLSTVYLLLSAFFGLFQSHPGDAISPPLPPASLAAVPHNASTRIASLLNNKTGERGQGVRVPPENIAFSRAAPATQAVYCLLAAVYFPLPLSPIEL